MTTIGELSDERRHLNRKVSDAISELYGMGHTWAQAEHDYRKAVAEAWAKAPEGTVPEREAWVKGQTADLRLARDMAQVDRQTVLEAVRSRRTQLSAWQTEANAFKSEADYVRTSPQETP